MVIVSNGIEAVVPDWLVKRFNDLPDSQQAKVLDELEKLRAASPGELLDYLRWRVEWPKGPNKSWSFSNYRAGVDNNHYNSSRLRTALEDGGVSFCSGEQAHHIVQATASAEASVKSRALLEYYQIEINGLDNGINLDWPHHRLTKLHNHTTKQLILERLRLAIEGLEDASHWHEA